MNICKKCGIEFMPEKGLINYCSLKCRNSREWSENDKLNKSVSAKNSKKVLNANKNRENSFYIKIANKRKENEKLKTLESSYDTLSFEKLRLRILFEQNECCNKCGISEWLGNKLILELEHKDGNHFNNKRENLEMLCPNCHSLTDTWRGRNKQNNKKKVSDEKLFESLLNNNWNIRQSLIDVGLAPKGGNYVRCYRLKNEYESAS